MKLFTILTTAVLMAGFVPFGLAICNPGDIGLATWNNVSITFQSANQLCVFDIESCTCMIRNGRSVRTTAVKFLLRGPTFRVGSLAMPK